MFRQYSDNQNLIAETRGEYIRKLSDNLNQHQFQNVIAIAEDILRKFNGDNGACGLAYSSSATAKARLGDLQGALSDADNALALDGKNGEAYVARAAAHYSLGKYNEAINDADIAIKLRLFNLLAYSIRAEAKLVNNDKNGAIMDAKSIVAIAKSFLFSNSYPSTFDTADAYRMMAAAKRMLGENSAAEEDEKAAAKLVSNPIPYLFKPKPAIGPVSNRRQSGLFDETDQRQKRQKMCDELEKREKEMNEMLRSFAN